MKAVAVYADALKIDVKWFNRTQFDVERDLCWVAITIATIMDLGPLKLTTEEHNWRSL